MTVTHRQQLAAIMPGVATGTPLTGAFYFGMLAASPECLRGCGGSTIAEEAVSRERSNAPAPRLGTPAGHACGSAATASVCLRRASGNGPAAPVFDT